MWRSRCLPPWGQTPGRPPPARRGWGGGEGDRWPSGRWVRITSAPWCARRDTACRRAPTPGKSKHTAPRGCSRCEGRVHRDPRGRCREREQPGTRHTQPDNHAGERDPCRSTRPATRHDTPAPETAPARTSRKKSAVDGRRPVTSSGSSADVRLHMGVTLRSVPLGPGKEMVWLQCMLRASGDACSPCSVRGEVPSAPQKGYLLAGASGHQAVLSQGVWVAGRWHFLSGSTSTSRGVPP